MTGRMRVVAVAAVGFMLAGSIACATGPDRREADRGPDHVVGAPPSEGSEDFEFAPPPRHPGPYGEVEARPAPRAGSAEVFTRGEMQRLRQLGPSMVFQHVDTEPYREGERFVGFRIIDFSDEAQSRLSPRLRVGDVITHVNLIKVETPEDYNAVWQSLEGADEIRVDLVRDGEAHQVTWRVQ